MGEQASNVYEMPLSAAPEPQTRSRAKTIGLVAGGVAAGIGIVVVAETVLPAYISPIKGKACPSERERNMAEEYRNMRKASRQAAKADKELKKATKFERKGEYDRAERLVNSATDRAAQADLHVSDSNEAAGKRGAAVKTLRGVAKTKLDTLRILKEKAAPHPAEDVTIKAEEPAAASTAETTAPAQGESKETPAA